MQNGILLQHAVLGQVLDFLAVVDSLSSDIEALANHGVDMFEVKHVVNTPADTYTRIASHHTRERQAFLDHRRNQNVHGRLDRYTRDAVGIRWFDGSNLVRETISADEFAAILLDFYEPDMTTSTISAIETTLGTDAMALLHALWQSSLQTDSLSTMGERLGVIGGVVLDPDTQSGSEM